jgi:hypothetical protein
MWAIYLCDALINAVNIQATSNESRTNITLKGFIGPSIALGL